MSKLLQSVAPSDIDYQNGFWGVFNSYEREHQASRIIHNYIEQNKSFTEEVCIKDVNLFKGCLYKDDRYVEFISSSYKDGKHNCVLKVKPSFVAAVGKYIK